MAAGRPGNDVGPCELADLSGALVQVVQAGARLKVGWISGNRGGGFVRLSLAPFADALSAADFDRSVSLSPSLTHTLYTPLNVNNVTHTHLDVKNVTHSP